MILAVVESILEVLKFFGKIWFAEKKTEKKPAIVFYRKKNQHQPIRALPSDDMVV